MRYTVRAYYSSYRALWTPDKREIREPDPRPLSNRWDPISEHRKKAEAIAAADQHPSRAVVTDSSLQTLYDNGKPAGEIKSPSDAYRERIR